MSRLASIHSLLHWNSDVLSLVLDDVGPRVTPTYTVLSRSHSPTNARLMLSCGALCMLEERLELFSGPPLLRHGWLVESLKY